MWLKLTTLFLIASCANAWEFSDSVCQSLGISESFIESYLAFREDSLKWKVKDKRHHPTIVNEFCFDDVKMIEKGVRSEVTFCESWTVLADGNFSVAYNKARDWAFDLTIGAGYHFNFCSNSLRLTPLFGYTINREHFHSCGESFLSKAGRRFDQRNLARLDSFYRAHWNSPWIGFDFTYAINECWKAYSALAYQFVTLHGKGHTDFGDLDLNGFQSRDRFHQRSHGWGWSWDAGIQYALDCNWLLDFGTQFEYRKAHHGHSHFHHHVKNGGGESSVGSSDSDSSGSDKNKHRIKRVEWRSLRIELGLSYRF